MVVPAVSAQLAVDATQLKAAMFEIVPAALMTVHETQTDSGCITANCAKRSLRG